MMFRSALVSPKMLMLVTKRKNADRCLFRRTLSSCRWNDEFGGHPEFCEKTPDLSRYILRLPPCLQLLQRPDHLRLRVPALRHTLFPFPSTKSYSFVRNEGIRSVPGDTMIPLSDFPAIDATLNGTSVLLLRLGYFFICRKKIQAHKGLHAFGVCNFRTFSRLLSLVPRSPWEKFGVLLALGMFFVLELLVTLDSAVRHGPGPRRILPL